MFSIARVRLGQERYYLSTIAASSDRPDGLIEPDPVFLGRGSRELGLGTQASPEAVRAVLGRRELLSGLPLPEPARGRVELCAYDLTFSAPKSVSLVHALAGPDQASRIREAHEQAVASALSFVEDELLFVRREKGSLRLVPRGAIGVAFLHRTSRASDPHLHSHLLLANLAQGEDGSFSALDARPLFTAQRLVRALYDAELRARLTREGYVFAPPRRGFADLAAIPPATVREFSRQGALVQAALRAAGPLRPGERDQLTALLRPLKDRSRPYESLVAEWKERAYETGLSPGRLAAALAPAPPPALDWPTDWVERAERDQTGSVSREELCYERAASAPAGALICEVLGEVDRLLLAGRLERAGDRYLVPGAAERLRVAAGELAAKAEGIEVRLLSYEKGGRLQALDRLAGLGGDSSVVAVAPGKRAAESLAASTGIEADPLCRLEGQGGRLDWVVAAECSTLSRQEIERSIDLARSSGAGLVLFGPAERIASSRLLSGLVEAGRRLEPERAVPEESVFDLAIGPVVVEALSRPSLACARAARLALFEAAKGRSALVIVPERCFVDAVRSGLRERGAASQVRVALAGRATPRGEETVIALGQLAGGAKGGSLTRSVLVLPGSGRREGRRAEPGISLAGRSLSPPGKRPPDRGLWR